MAERGGGDSWGGKEPSAPFILRGLGHCSGGFCDATFSTLDLGENGKQRKIRTRHGMDVGGGGTCAAQFHLPLCSVGFEMENSSKEQSGPSRVKALCCRLNPFAFNESP